jgi:hypothetical protein
VLIEGDIVELRDGHRVYASVPEHFVYANRKGSFKLTKTDVNIGGNFAYLAGRYVVTKAYFDGGSSSCGVRDGHHVFCEKLGIQHDANAIEVDFYEGNPGFSAQIESIAPVGRCRRVWVEDLTEGAINE